jgi:hypothetical protein
MVKILFFEEDFSFSHCSYKLYEKKLYKIKIILYNRNVIVSLNSSERFLLLEPDFTDNKRTTVALIPNVSNWKEDCLLASS